MEYSTKLKGSEFEVSELRLTTYYTDIVAAIYKKYGNSAISNIFSNVVIKNGLRRGGEDYYKNKDAIYLYPEEHLFNSKFLNDTDFFACSSYIYTKINIQDIPIEPILEKEDRHSYFLFDVNLNEDRLIFLTWLINFFKEYDLDALHQRLRFFNMDFVGDRKRLVFDVFRDIDNPFASTIPLFAVSHTEKDNKKHVHVYYILDANLELNKKDLRKIPHVEQLINTVYTGDEDVI